MKRFLPVFAGFMALVFAHTAFAQMQPVVPMRAISVSGEATEDVVPDRAVMNVTLMSKNANLTAAKQHNDSLVKKLVAVMQSFSIPSDKVATSSLYVSPEYSYDNGESRMIGYVVSRSLRITMDKLDIHERVLSAVIDAGVDQVSGAEFRLADPEARAQKVRVKAYENARAKAQALAIAAGLKLGAPISISTTGAMPVMPVPMAAEVRMDTAATSSVAPSLPGLITLHESVSVVFGLE